MIKQIKLNDIIVTYNLTEFNPLNLVNPVINPANPANPVYMHI